MDRKTSVDIAFDKLAVFLSFSLGLGTCTDPILADLGCAADNVRCLIMH